MPVLFPGENKEEKQKILNIEFFSSLIANYPKAKQNGIWHLFSQLFFRTVRQESGATGECPIWDIFHQYMQAGLLVSGSSSSKL